MINPIIKVDRVASLEEAQELEALGVELIGISLGDVPIFSDQRQVTQETVIKISEHVAHTHICVQLSCQEEIASEIANFIQNCPFSFVQIPINTRSHPQFKKDILESGKRLIYSGIDVSSDDDPSWILSRFNDIEEKGSYYQLELLADRENSWEFLKEECPQYQEEIQIHEIDELAERNPLLISLDFNSLNIGEIMNSFKHVRGINFTLGRLKNDRYGVHVIEYCPLLEILAIIRNNFK